MGEQVTTSRGDVVAYDRLGEGPTVVLVAGAGSLRGDARVVRTTELLAAAGVTAVVPDRLGRGSSAAEGTLDLDRELEALRAVVDANGGTAVLCGHSSGCSISLHAAAAGLPVAGLVLWEAPLAAPAARVADWVEGLEQRIDAGELEAAQEWYMRDMPPEWLAGAKASPAWPAIYAGVVALRADAQSLGWATEQLESGGLRDAVTVPVLATYGSSTQASMVEAADRVRRVLPRTEVREVAGAHHTWEPDAFAPVLATFTRACLPG
ncbi:Pimeloyl-ACP methyl ester carboxylesterase [Microlunatus sagamiharensis]|uniref:Pimeloyl-ACP methyl ester carboxylesterase n=1 Tax=Microlunatus sagamiharensis TaxID=546874 RepID=A0A1H2N4V6_9ACTN|nr:alpha/beta hydrolase [Microlunatus sagamiharensis]SDV00115.1 Pimeloyl-ACP methyl ester carboxylesterase [Microlunatus sagamiharensis]